MTLNGEWPWNFQNAVIIENREEIDTITVLLEFVMGKISPHF
jgi:hypothetical protein